jgi:hypothetical protein
VGDACDSPALQFECFADSHFNRQIKQLAVERPKNEYEEDIEPIRRHVKACFTLGFIGSNKIITLS